MAVIGSYGEIVFEVSDKRKQTFRDFERNGSARWDNHAIHLLKPISEFNGPELEQISLVVTLKVEHGVNPVKQLEKLRKMRDTGKVASFILGGKPISQNDWKLQSMAETNQRIDNKGNIMGVDVSLQLEEYVVRKKKTKKVVPKNAVKSTATSSKRALGKMTITVKSVHIRSGPGVNHKVVGYAYKGQSLTVQSEKNGWYSLGQGKYISASSSYSKLQKG